MSKELDQGAPLPDDLEPINVLDLCITIPDAPEYRQAFWGQLWLLGNRRFWERDTWADSRREVAAQVWRTFISLSYDRYMNGEGCDSVSEILDAIAALEAQISDVKSELRSVLYDGTPGSLNGEAPGARFDSDLLEGQTGDEFLLRRAALCVAVRRFVNETVYQFHARAAAAAGVSGAAGAVAFLLGGPVGFVVGAFVLALTAYTYQQVLDAASDQNAIDDIVCDLYNLLAGQAVSQSNFASAISVLPTGTGNRAVLVDMLKTFRNRIENYTFMLDLLGNGYTAAQAGAEDDCCPPEVCEFYWDFTKGSQGWRVLSGEIQLGEGFVGNHDSGTSRSGQIRLDWDEPCFVTDFCIHLNYPVAQSGTGVNVYRRVETSPGVFEHVLSSAIGSGPTPGEIFVTAGFGDGITPTYGVQINVIHTGTDTIFKRIRSFELRSDDDCSDPEWP